MKLELSWQILEKTLKYQISLKIWPLGAELFHVDGQKDTGKLTVAPRNFSNVPKNGQNGPTDLNGSLQLLSSISSLYGKLLLSFWGKLQVQCEFLT